MLAVFFTFAALASEVLWHIYKQLGQNERKQMQQRKYVQRYIEPSYKYPTTLLSEASPGLAPLSASGARVIPPPSDYPEDTEGDDVAPQQHGDESVLPRSSHSFEIVHAQNGRPSISVPDRENEIEQLLPGHPESSLGYSNSERESFGDPPFSRLSWSILEYPPKNAFVVTGESFYHGFTLANVAEGFCWSIAITSMHYVGIFALRIPGGYAKFSLPLVILSAAICWVACVVGCIQMPQMENYLSQQLLFSVTATAGVAGLHFTGKLNLPGDRAIC
jgi:Bacterial signalling protein N terminal repeat